MPERPKDSPIRAVISDFGGVLIRNEDNRKREAWTRRLNAPTGALESLVFESDVSQRGAVGACPVDAVWEHVRETLGLSDSTLAQLREDFWWGDRVNTELVAYLRDLRATHTLAILSNAWSDARDRFTQLGLDTLVDLMIISAEVGLVKPDPQIYRLTLDALGVQPAEALFIDDMLENVEAARALGMRAVHYQDNAQAIAEIAAHLSAR